MLMESHAQHFAWKLFPFDGWSALAVINMTAILITEKKEKVKKVMKFVL